MVTSSMAAHSGPPSNQNWLTDTGTSDHIILDLAQLSLPQQPTAGETIIVGNGQALPVTHFGMVSFLLLYTISTLITSLGYYRLL